MHSRFRLGLVILGPFVAVVSSAQAPAVGSTQPDALQRERIAQIKKIFTVQAGARAEKIRVSNVQYTITVTDTQTQAVKTYTNPDGTLASVADTSAF